MSKTLKARAFEAIDKAGMLLVFPIDNRPEFPSLWSTFWPRTKMDWEWDENGSERLPQLWHLREELSRSGKVVYAKWFRDRATFMSRPVFTAMHAALGAPRSARDSLSREARTVLETLEMDSPLSTKQLKRATDLQGRDQESRYHRALKELWTRLLIVAYGEVDEGAFPSLAIGASDRIFEDLCEEARAISREDAVAQVGKLLPADSPYLAHFNKTLKSLSQAKPREVQRFARPKAGGISFRE